MCPIVLGQNPLWITFSWVLMFYLHLAPLPSAVLSVSPGEGRTGPSLFSARNRTGSQHTELWLFLWLCVFPERSWNRIIHTSHLAGGELWRWLKKKKKLWREWMKIACDGFLTAEYKMLLYFRIHLGVYYNQKTNFCALGWSTCSEREHLTAFALWMGLGF